ncbi:MAG: ExbD/TolR family protein [Pseudomonadota bacterium]|jgi:biopolymer transport protein ExbD
MRRRFTPQDDEAQIDLTPMLDVVFIMLIFFIVTASFVKEAGWTITRPEANQPPPPEDQKKQNVLITITSNNQILLNRFTRITTGAVGPNIQRLLAENPEASVVIQAQKGAKINTYALVHDAAIEAGVMPEKIVMATSE